MIKNTDWRIVAAILFIALLFETLFLAYSYNLGKEMERQELECALQCSEYEGGAYLITTDNAGYYSFCECYVGEERVFYEVFD